jgi:SAM-dependent methyltransferase
VISTRINPGAFQGRRARGIRTIASEAARALRKQRYRAAALGVMADAVNLFEAYATQALPARYRCSCCGHEARAFLHLAAGGRVAWNSACPGCDSRSRHRGLAVLLPELLEDHAPRRVLHFAPEPVLRSCFQRPEISYETADLFLEDVTHTRVDLQQLPFVDATYDLIACNHVLEHVPDDQRALAELARVLKPGGLAVITVPGEFSRRETLYFSGELDNGHYRDYGLDLVDRLLTVFADVRSIDLHDFDRDPGGLSRAIRRGDMAFVCQRAA